MTEHFSGYTTQDKKDKWTAQPLKIPEGASALVRAAAEATQATVQDNIDNLGAGTPTRPEGPSSTPDQMHKEFTSLLYYKRNDSDHQGNHSVAVDNHTTAVQKLHAIRDSLNKDDQGVDTHSYGAYTAGSDAYHRIKTSYQDLEKVFEDSAGRTLYYTNAQGNYITDANGNKEPYLPADVESKLLKSCDSTVNVVYDQMGAADADIKEHAKHIAATALPNPTTSSFGGKTWTTPWTHVSSALPIGKGTANDIVQTAMREFKAGVHETNGDNHPVGGRAQEYDIGDSWCSSFATWVWKQSGIKGVSWSNKNYVPSVWSDAVSQGLADKASNARVGDMVVFGGEHHIGVVVGVNKANGTITTIEGNSGDQVAEHQYNLSAANFQGVVHPPDQQTSNAG